MPCPDLLLSAPPSFSEQLRKRTDQLRSKIIKANHSTQFAQNAAGLTGFRDATAGSVNAMDDDTLSEIFRKTVPFTTYEPYAPFIARLLEKPCKATAIANLLAPGVPDYIAESSSTSGGICKTFPKYRCLPKMAPLDAGSGVIPDPPQKRTTAFLEQLWFEPTVHVEDDDGCPIKTVYVANVTVIYVRIPLNLHPEEDGEKMGTFILDHAAPYAAQFIAKLRSFLLIHSLFALGSKSLENIVIPFSSTFVDMMRHLDTEFDTVVDCLAKGTIPELDGIADVRHYLEMNMSPDPERAAELRSLGRPSSQPGWCSRAWPNLHSVMVVTSGSFATYAPLVRWFLGPDINISPHVYGSTEGLVALPYNLLESNQYKLADENVVEFLDVAKDDAISALSQAWETEVGKRYELVLTTPDGLWRYRLGDVIEISGFDPVDGVPVMQVIERRNVSLRFFWFLVSEEQLGAAILSMAPNTALQIVGWTSIIDDRSSPVTIGFFVELTGDQATDLTLATQHVLDELSRRNNLVKEAIEYESFRRPTIRIVQHGTFSVFLQLKLDEANSNRFGQIKVPPVVSKEAHITWFSNRVVREL